MSKDQDQAPHKLPEFSKRIRSDRPKPILGRLIILLLLFGIIGLGLSWMGVLPDFIQRQLPEADPSRPPPFTAEDVQDAWGKMLAKLQEARASVGEQEGDKAAGQSALAKLGEVQALLDKWREEGAPRLKEAAGELSQKTKDAMAAVRAGSRDARQKLEELIDQVNQLKEEKEPDKR